MDLHKLGIKFFTDDAAIEPRELIPVFHGWIQRGELDDLLIDVADYSHVHAGPGVLLVAHDGNYAFDEAANRPGLMYYRKRSAHRNLVQRSVQVCRKALIACRLLERASETRGCVRFRGEVLRIVANDRLVAPNNDETYAAIEPVIHELARRLYPGSGYQLVREPDPRERFAVTVTADRPVSVEMLIDRLAA